MIKFKTEEDVKKYFQEKEDAPSKEFQNGAEWAVKTNEEYVNYLLKRISGLNNKILELSEKITDYEITYCGVEPMTTRKTKRRCKESFTSEDERDGILAEMESIYGVTQDEDDEDYGPYGYEG